MGEAITVVWVTTQFEAFHKWDNAPEDVKFLRDYHRHMFHVKLGVRVVTGYDRQVEFIQLKRVLDSLIDDKLRGRYTTSSCEAMAHCILQWLTEKDYAAVFCDVSEDGENGVMVQIL